MRCVYDVRVEKYRLYATWDEMEVLGLQGRGEIRKVFNQTQKSGEWLAKAKYRDKNTQEVLNKAGIKIKDCLSIRDILSDYLPEGLCDEAVERIKEITVYKKDYNKVYFEKFREVKA